VTLGHRHGQRPPRPVAGRGQPQGRAGQREAVPLVDPVGEPEADDRQDVCSPFVEGERLLEGRFTDRPALGAEPALARDGVEVEGRDRLGDLGPGRIRDVSRPC
jgi:hypothetical protein